MALKQHIQSQLVQAMKSNDKVKVDVLRMLKASILKYEVSGERKEASDETVIDLINKEIKQRKESAEQYRAGNRFDLAEKEEKEIDCLIEYMPPQLTEEEVIEIVNQTIQETGAKGLQDLGRVMGAVMPKVKGKADGAVINRVVKALLVQF
jgi:uncharacterized protein